MTNAQIIFIEGQKLAEAGIINYTGMVLKALNLAGEEVEVKETEPIHTYAAWKELGYQVQKGQKAVAKFPVWKYTSKKNEETGEEENAHMFMKTASFFRLEQVAPITA